MITPRYIILILTFVVSVSSATLLGGDVGGACLNDIGRPCSIPNSECIEGVCLCANFHRFFNGSCIQLDTVSTIGKQCRSGEECRGQGEFCSSFGICMCLSTHVELGMQCKPIVYPEQFGCEDSRQCSKGYPGAECDASRKCVCPHGMHSHLQTCVTPSLLANLILSEDQLQRRYQNNHKYLHGNLNRRRLAPISTTSNGIAPDSICSVDSDCAGHPLSYCDGVCKCIPGSLNAGSTCISGALQSAGSCPPGQTYITELGACMTGPYGLKLMDIGINLTHRNCLGFSIEFKFEELKDHSRMCTSLSSRQISVLLLASMVALACGNVKLTPGRRP
uniref:EB domain-containing protein n=1 Tax=Heterorhabditis bacteriophora TaxID=37862 RepID=A0A1I7X0B8_HETBA